MAYAYFSDQENNEYPVCLLVPSIKKDEIKKAYIDTSSLNKDDLMVMTLHYTPGQKKTKAAEMKEYITSELVPILEGIKTKYVLCADSDYFKILTKAAKVESHIGYVMDSVFGNFKVIYVPNYRQIFYDPDKVKARIKLGMDALTAHRAGSYQALGTGIIHFAEYPETTQDIAAWLEKLLAMNCPLAIDIEGFDLKHHKCGIGTISFAWNQHEGIAFAVDYVNEPWVMGEGKDEVQMYGKKGFNAEVRALLKSFFTRYMQTAIYHNIAFDAYVLVYQLFMSDLLDTEGLLEGMSKLLKNWDCTKLITYLATNSCAGNKLGLKHQAHEFAGNYAIDGDDIKDIRRIPLPKLLEYNLVDSLSTWFTFRKHQPTMIQDQQLEIYENLFKPSTLDIVQMQLTGLPLHMPTVLAVEEALQGVFDDAVNRMLSTRCVQQFQYSLKEMYIEKKHKEWKNKRITIDEVPDKIKFNPRSNPQLQHLLYEQLNLPVLSYTDSKQPSCDGDTIDKLQHHTTDPDILELLSALIDFAAVDKILGSFIPAFKEAALGPDGWHYLFGNSVLGGTVSGRLSSNSPNLQNLPANVTMKISEALLKKFPLLKRFMKKGKLSLGSLVKSCFQAPPGWIFAGLDFASLEDRISALTTKDPNKLKVYTDGYDGHCLRSYAYFGNEMPDIDSNSVASINSIELKYKDFRQESKAPTFALTYQGTYITLMTNCGFSESKAKMIEAKYKELYAVSINWVQEKLNQASKDGYVTVAFGLRVRTPLLHQVIRGNRSTPFEAEAEGRTAGNALGQSWCLLNNRASAEFMGGVRKSEYRTAIRPCAHIHDAQYMLIKDDIRVVLYVNEHLVKAVQWQDHPDIAHDEVKLGGDLSLFFPDWSEEVTVHNGATESEIQELTAKHIAYLNGEPK
jgi:DNA polymerase-1